MVIATGSHKRAFVPWFLIALMLAISAWVPAHGSEAPARADASMMAPCHQETEQADHRKDDACPQGQVCQCLTLCQASALLARAATSAPLVPASHYRTTPPQQARDGIVTPPWRPPSHRV